MFSSEHFLEYILVGIDIRANISDIICVFLIQEVAVKKFLDQDFFGDALDEFISEVR